MPELAQRLSTWFLSRRGIELSLEGTSCRIDSEKSAPGGGIPDLWLEFYRGDNRIASLVIENKLDAPVDNPLKDYIDEVRERRILGEASLLVLISRR